MVPLSYRTASGTSSLLLSEDEQRVQVNTSGPVIVNAGGHAFMGIEYDNELRSRITRKVLPTLDVLERYTLVDDAIAAVATPPRRIRSSRHAHRVPRRRCLSVWQSITAGLRLISHIIGDTDERSTFEETVRNLCKPTLQRLGAPAKDEDDLVGSLRGLLMKTVAFSETTPRRSKSVVRSSTIQLPQRPILNCSPLRQRSLPVAATH